MRYKIQAKFINENQPTGQIKASPRSHQSNQDDKKHDFNFKELMDIWQEKGIIQSGKYEFVMKDEVLEDY